MICILVMKELLPKIIFCSFRLWLLRTEIKNDILFSSLNHSTKLHSLGWTTQHLIAHNKECERSILVLSVSLVQQLMHCVLVFPVWIVFHQVPFFSCVSNWCSQTGRTCQGWGLYFNSFKLQCCCCCIIWMYFNLRKFCLDHCSCS